MTAVRIGAAAARSSAIPDSTSPGRASPGEFRAACLCTSGPTRRAARRKAEGVSAARPAGGGDARYALSRPGARRRAPRPTGSDGVAGTARGAAAGRRPAGAARLSRAIQAAATSAASSSSSADRPRHRDHSTWVRADVPARAAVCYDSPCTLTGTTGTRARWPALVTSPSFPRGITPRVSRVNRSPTSAAAR